METKVIGNRDCLSVQEYRLACCKANEIGEMIDDQGNSYPVNRFGVSYGIHPAEELSYKLSEEILTTAFDRHRAEKLESQND